MSFAVEIDSTLPPAAFYAEMVQAANSLMHGESDRVANAANLSALIFNGVPNLNWAGFYFYDGTELVVGPFQGLPACVRIGLGKGVCGTAAAERKIMRVDNVNDFPGHIACDSASQSELVLPLVKDGHLLGVLDLDSPSPGRFSADDEAGMAQLAQSWLDAIY